VTFPRNVDCRWFVTREGTWSVHIYCSALPPDGHVFHTNETMMSTAMRFAASPVMNLITEACLERGKQ
jgi:hypothetical protein